MLLRGFQKSGTQSGYFFEGPKSPHVCHVFPFRAEISGNHPVSAGQLVLCRLQTLNFTVLHLPLRHVFRLPAAQCSKSMQKVFCPRVA